MRIGNYKYEQGAAAPVGKWLFSVEVLRCPPHSFRIFRPYVFVIAMKIIEHGTMDRVDGKPMVKRGGYWHWSSPFGISFEWHRF